MTEIFYTSDQHIGHSFVAGLRAGIPRDQVTAQDIQDHNDWLAERWDSVVKKDSQVWVLGDISIRGKGDILDWWRARPGTKHLIAGNHDPVHSMNRDSYKVMPEWLEIFASIQMFARRKLAGQDVLLSHFPYMPYDRVEPRFAQYRLPNLGLPLLHGHVHSDQKTEYPNQFHVGVDAWDGLPVAQPIVQEWLTTQKEKAQ